MKNQTIIKADEVSTIHFCNEGGEIVKSYSHLFDKKDFNPNHYEPMEGYTHAIIYSFDGRENLISFSEYSQYFS